MNNISKIENQIISADLTLIAALKKMDEVKTKRLFVFNGDKFDCILTMGDIQRAIIKNVALTNPIAEILDRGKIYGKEGQSIENIKEVMFRENIDCMPILNNEGEIVDVLFWADVFQKSAVDTRDV